MASAQLKNMPAVPSAKESIAACHALFHSQSRGGLVYDNLPKHIRAMICFGARLSAAHIDKKLSEMNDLERTKIFNLINELLENLNPLSTCSLREFQ
ncbi:TPA: hypothetical protein ACX6S8_002653 [Photobacterium damselae]|uniref:hypothetical protein n=1 Tax=Photobacterium damselae TaxID=38293 RepID=UPI001EFE867C|nr:hypothetical protein [Photobacterium damselae]MCG9778707.1 hypothetical protein [Photobacterium damselae]